MAKWILMHGRVISENVQRSEAEMDRLQLPRHLGGAVVLGSIGHLEDAERHQLWQFFANTLSPGCRAVVQLMPPDRPEVQPLTLYASEMIGQRQYEGWSAAEPSGPRPMRWTMTSRILESGQLVDERVVVQDYRTLGKEDLILEAATAGLECDSPAAGFVRLVRES